jgi:tRNA nucleotidyltransferase (CCA-adding enzyme)
VSAAAPAPEAGLQHYLVGGAVRDALLGRPIKDRDYVVVGATPEQMLARGFRAVGADFPVFLHPQSQAEYALARTERKISAGYRGFSVHAAPEVSLEADLARRDLTINAIAQTLDGTLIDPFGGADDLKQRVLRHVSPAFIEDPLRVLRVARFAAQLAPFGFRIAPETLALMQRIVASGELATLTPERVFEELKKALVCTKPSIFLRALKACGALAVVFPEIAALYGKPQRAEYHPEIDTGLHQEMVSDQAAILAPQDALVAFAALTHDLGKAITPTAELPRHLAHEQHGVAIVERFCARLRVPQEWARCAAIVCAEHLNLHRFSELRAASVHDLFARVDAWRKPDRVRVLALACEADARGRLGLEQRHYPQSARLQHVFAAARSVSAQPLIERGLQGAAIADALRISRINAIRSALEAASENL